MAAAVEIHTTSTGWAKQRQTPRGAGRSGPGRLLPRHCVADDRVVKPVLLIDENRHAFALISKSRRLALAALNREFQRRFRLAAPDEAARLYPRLTLHDLLPAGMPGNVEVFIDQALVRYDVIVFETGIARRSLRVEGEAICGLFEGAWCGAISISQDS